MRIAIPLRVIVVLTILLAYAPALASTTSRSSEDILGPRVLASGQYGKLGPARVVNVMRLPAVARGSHPRLPLPFHPRDAARFQQAKRQAGLGSAPSVLTPNTATISPASEAVALGEQMATSFPVVSLSQQEGWYPDQGWMPPDTQLAAGPTYLLELVNDSGSVWDKSGNLVRTYDLNAFFPVPAGYSFSDPRVLFDLSSQRWFASGFSVDAANDSQLYLAVSATLDPGGDWNVYTIAQNPPPATPTATATSTPTVTPTPTAPTSLGNILYDQPKLGMSDDKVVISANDFQGASNLNYMGTQTWVIQKSDLLAGGADVATWTSDVDPGTFNLVPAHSLSPTNVEYLTTHDASSVGIVAITGTPAGNDVAWTETDLPINATAPPPNATQPGGVPPIDTNDDRFLSTVWQNGILWTTGNDACTPAGGIATHSCLRLIQVSTNGGTPSLLQDFDVGATDADLYFPAVSMDLDGNAFFAFSESSGTLYASAATAAQRANAVPGSLGGILTVQPGTGVYNVCGQQCQNGKSNRWGDYSSVAPDSTDPSRVWVAAEYAQGPQGDGDWETGAAAVFLPKLPTATPTSTATRTPTSTPTRTPTITNTPTATNTPTVTNTPTMASVGTPVPRIYLPLLRNG